MTKIGGTMRPMTLSEFIDLMNLRFKLFGRSDTQKKFDKYKHDYYTESTDGHLIVKDLSFIETPISDED